MVDDEAYFYEEECPSTTDEDATEDHVERENSPGIDAVGLGTALVLGATVGLGVGVSVAAVATIASRHIQQHGPSMMEKLGIKAFWKRKPLTSERWCEEVDGEGHVRNFACVKMRSSHFAGCCNLLLALGMLSHVTPPMALVQCTRSPCCH